MFNQNPNPRLSKRRTITLMVALTILAWATQTLFHQWGYGAEPGGGSTEKFISANPAARGATVEIRAEASIIGTEVRFKQIARWGEMDQPALAPLAELVLARFQANQPFRSLTVDEIKTVLRQAGVNAASINFTGAASVTISRADVHYDEHVALLQWIDAKSGEKAQTPAPATQPALASIAAVPQSLQVHSREDPGANRSSVRTLRDLLIADLAQRLNLAPENLQVDFRPQDQRILNLCDSQFTFALDAVRVRSLGPVEWAVTIATADASQQKVTIPATARVWQDQLIVAKPIAYKQIIQSTDVTEKRSLVSDSGGDPIVTRSQAIGQQAARELKSGTVLTARMIDPIQLVKTGQYVTINVSQGGVQIKTVARSLEAGTFGQSIKVKNETTKDIYDVTVTGPQTAALTAPPAQNGLGDLR
jgi:flagella basal body P-ring formation protein FlgA